MEHARQSELRKNAEYTPLLDQLDLVMALLLGRLIQGIGQDTTKQEMNACATSSWRQI